MDDTTICSLRNLIEFIKDRASMNDPIHEDVKLVEVWLQEDE